jgi:hypothetical protein
MFKKLSLAAHRWLQQITGANNKDYFYNYFFNEKGKHNFNSEYIDVVTCFVPVIFMSAFPHLPV